MYGSFFLQGLGLTRQVAFRWSALAALVVASAVVTAGCEQFAGGSGAESRLLAAANRMEQVKTAHFATNGFITGKETNGGTLTASTNFAIDGDAIFPDRQHGTIVLSNGHRVESEFIRIDKDVWIKNPQTGDWTLGRIEGLQIQPMAPLEVVTLIRSASQSINDMGQEQVGDSAVRHLQVVLDPARTRLLIAQANPDLGDKIRSVAGTVDLWITEDNLVRQLMPDITVDATNIGGENGQPIAGQIHTNFTMSLSDFDAPVTIERPVSLEPNGAGTPSAGPAVTPTAAAPMVTPSPAPMTPTPMPFDQETTPSPTPTMPRPTATPDDLPATPFVPNTQ